MQDRFFVGGDNLRGFAAAPASGRATRDRRRARRQQILSRLGGLGRAAGPAEGTRASAGGSSPISARLWSNRSEEHRADPGAARLDRRRAAESSTSPAIRASAGVGVSWKSPVGPIRLDLAHSDQEGTIRQDPAVPRQFRYEVLMSFDASRLSPLLLALLSGSLAALWRKLRRRRTPPPARRRRRPPADAPTPLTVMVVDVQALLQNSKAAKMVRQPDRAEAQRIHQGDFAPGGDAAAGARCAAAAAGLAVGRCAEPEGPRIPAEGQRSRPQCAGQAPGAREIEWRGALERSKRRC